MAPRTGFNESTVVTRHGCVTRARPRMNSLREQRPKDRKTTTYPAKAWPLSTVEGLPPTTGTPMHDLERRANQLELIRNSKPWERSTGPRTAAGKARVSRNPWKGGSRATLTRRAWVGTGRGSGQGREGRIGRCGRNASAAGAVTGGAFGPPGLPSKACRRQAWARPGARSTNRPGLERGLKFLSASAICSSTRTCRLTPGACAWCSVGCACFG